MYVGKTLFVHVMDILPWKTFHHIVSCYSGGRRVRTLTCAEQLRCMAFAQLTYRESLRDIKACLSAQAAKLYHMGFRQPVSRSTLADANESRDWHIYTEFALHLIVQAKTLYAGDALSVDLSNTVYALDATTIDLCLSVFPWATSVRPRRRSGCTRCSICAAVFRALSTFRMANCTRSMCSTS
jgi:hypothetical protein